MAKLHRGGIFYKVLLLCYFGVVAYLCFGHFSNIPNIQRSYFGIPTDKIVHFLMFFPFPVLVTLAFRRFGKKAWHSILSAAIVLILGSIMAGATEIGQYFTLYRSCDINDFHADLLALGISSLLVAIVEIIGRVYNNEA